MNVMSASVGDAARDDVIDSVRVMKANPDVEDYLLPDTAGDATIARFTMASIASTQAVKPANVLHIPAGAAEADQERWQVRRIMDTGPRLTILCAEVP